MMNIMPFLYLSVTWRQ